METQASSVRSLERGLRLLQAMNRAPHASVTQLAIDIEVPRSTAYRLLDTLVGLGFVTFGPDGYALSREVRTLSDGFIDEAWITPAWAEMVEISRKLIWPVSLFTVEAATMVIRRTTHELSTLSIDYGMSGKRLPITETAAGRVYLAFCSHAERRSILSMPAAYVSDPTRLERERIEARLEQARQRGYDTRVGGVVARTGSLAVPVLVEGRVLCSLSIIYIASSLSVEQAIEQFEQPMKDAAGRIADAVVRLSDASPALVERNS
ncbi:helix-turn-helix domain-containing protein [Sphingomonas sp. GB1N7]|uniref:helix-turn-helix domain-containing protein n=1 Tax=Parasphingomonas caseinilytica TaxID=3096158 RepID=UPI002FC975C4